MGYSGPHEIESSVTSFLARDHALFIDGQFVRPTGTDQIAVDDPASGKVIAQVSSASSADVDAAISSAHTAFEDGRWRNLRPADRERILLRLADLLEARAEAFAQLETLEQGKSIHISRAIEVGASIEWIRYAAGLTTKISGRTFDVSLPGGPTRWTSYTRREPVGVVAGIVPWNFPLMIALWKVLPALASGCSIVLKPSEITPLTALWLAELAREAGVPDGVFNVVTGAGEVGRWLSVHPLVAKISFTGSTVAGKAVGTAAIDGMKRFTLELGGKNPAIVLEDAILDKVVPGLLTGGLLNGGQVCAAVSRIYVTRNRFDPLCEALEAAIQAMVMGSGMDPAAQLTPLASATHRAKVEASIQQAAEAGVLIRRGAQAPAEGHFVSPALVIDPDEKTPLARQEVFGPVLSITPVESEEEALQRANDSTYGLAASIWTQDIDKAMAISQRVQSGTVWINSHVFIDPNMPFGGMKMSGIGRDFGSAWLDGYLEEKAVCIAH
jgi:phenylacetaldehyde dehydrogenase